MADIVILTGAGVSADSGVATFRDAGGVWAQYDVNEVATPEGYAANPALVHEFYNLRRADMQKVVPNPAHDALAALEKSHDILLVTQNVDDLHERAGSKNLLHMHGELAKIRCTSCGAVKKWLADLSIETVCDCGAKGFLRPHIVWFGEMPMHMERIEEILAAAKLFVSIGTSGSVYPAAGFVAMAQAQGIQTAELNLEPSQNAVLFDEAHYGPAAEVVPIFVEMLMAKSEIVKSEL